MDKLEAVYNNITYFAGYYFRMLPYDLRLKGNIPAEINPSIIIFYPRCFMDNHLSNYDFLRDNIIISMRRVQLKIIPM